MKVNEPKYIIVELSEEEKNILSKAENIFVDLLSIMEDRKLDIMDVTGFEWTYNDLEDMKGLLYFLGEIKNIIKFKR